MAAIGLNGRRVEQKKSNMASLGDMKNNVRILQSEAKLIKYGGELDLDGLSKGNPQSMLPLYHHLFTSYNPYFSEEVVNILGDGLCLKSDIRFIECIYRLFRDFFHFKPPMTKEQFFTMHNFAERKIIMCCDVIRMVREHCYFLGPRNPTNPKIHVQPVVDTGRGRVGKRPTDIEILPADPSSAADPAMTRKTKCRMGYAEKGGWQTKLGYLRPKSAEGGDEGRKSGHCSREDHDKDGWQRRAGYLSPKFPEGGDEGHKSSMEEHERAALDSQHQRVREALGQTKDQDWDPSEAVECILTKVRDLPTQLQAFMKAVEDRLQRIEERLDNVEAATTRLYQNEEARPPGGDKSEIDTLQSRLTLLENKVLMCESKSARSGSADRMRGRTLREGMKTPPSEGTFGFLERGDTSLLKNFSPIDLGLGEGDAILHSLSDTVTSVADEDRRLSSTPNNSSAAAVKCVKPSQSEEKDLRRLSSTPKNSSATTVQRVTASPADERDSNLHSHSGTLTSYGEERDSNLCSHSDTLTSQGKERGSSSIPRNSRSPETQAEGSDLTTLFDNLDMSTQQQVERIKSLLQATQQLLPAAAESTKET